MPRSVILPACTSTEMSIAAVRSSALSAARAFALQRDVREQLARCGRFPERGARSERQNLLDGRGDRHALGVDREVVERRIAPAHVEVLGHARRARRVVDLDLPARELLVVGFEALHQPLHAQFHRRAHADARDVRHGAQQHGGAPAADQHVALDRELVDLLGGEDRDGPLVGRPALDLARLALADAADEALLHLHAAGHHVAHLVAHLLQAEGFAHGEGHVLAERGHLLGHRDHGHGVTPRRLRCRARAPPGSAAR